MITRGCVSPTRRDVSPAVSWSPEIWPPATSHRGSPRQALTSDYRLDVAEVVDLGVERAHRVLAVVGKGGQRTLVPLAARTVCAIDAALGGRTDGPLLVSNDFGRLDRHDAARIVARLARRAASPRTACGIRW